MGDRLGPGGKVERRGIEADDGRRKKAVCEKVLLTCSGRVKTSFRFAINKIEVSYGHGTPRRTLTGGQNIRRRPINGSHCENRS